MRPFIEDTFLKHPRSAEENYFQHLWFTLKISFRLLLIVLACTIHGLVPRFFQTYTSNTVFKLNSEFKERRDKHHS